MTNIFNPSTRSLMPGASSLQRGGLAGSGHITPTSVGFPSLSSSLAGAPPSATGQVSPNRGRDVFAAARLQRGADLSRLNLGSSSFGGLAGPSRGPIGSTHGGGPLGHHGHHHSHHGFPDGIGPTPPTLDQSEFPSLSYRALGGGSIGSGGGSGFGSVSGSSSGGHHGDSSAGSGGLLPGRGPYGISNFRMTVGMVKQASSEPAEFTMTSEDFPALPGAQGGSEALGGSSDSKSGSSQDSSLSGYQGIGSMGGLTSGPGVSSGLASGGMSNGPSKGSGSSSRGPGIQWYPDGRMTNIPGGMLRDQYGIAGLLAFIKTAEADSSLVTLTLGTELTNLGLNLSSQEPLHTSFGGASFECPIRPQDMDYPVPQEYRINTRIRETLAPIKLNRYGEDLLFYIFYMNPQDLLQMAAAAELYNREWRYHKEEKAWITRAPGMVPVEKTSSYERGTYYFFDSTSWRKIVKEFVLEYDKLEDRPPFPHNPSASSVAPGPPHSQLSSMSALHHQQPPSMLGGGPPPPLSRLPHPSQQVPPQGAPPSQPPNMAA